MPAGPETHGGPARLAAPRSSSCPRLRAAGFSLAGSACLRAAPQQQQQLPRHPPRWGRHAARPRGKFPEAAGRWRCGGGPLTRAWLHRAGRPARHRGRRRRRRHAAPRRQLPGSRWAPRLLGWHWPAPTASCTAPAGPRTRCAAWACCCCSRPPHPRWWAAGAAHPCSPPRPPTSGGAAWAASATASVRTAALQDRQSRQGAA